MLALSMDVGLVKHVLRRRGFAVQNLERNVALHTYKYRRPRALGS